MKTGINYLKFALDKDNKCPMLFQTAEMLQMEVMQEFSIWLLANNWEFNYTTRIWENYENPFQYSFTDVYQLFLKSREA